MVEYESGLTPFVALPNPENVNWLPEDQKVRFRSEHPIAIAPPHVARRLAIQRSQFVLFGKNPSALLEAEREAGSRLVKIEIVGKRAEFLLSELMVLGIFETTLFPDLEGLSRELERKYAGPKRS